MRLFRNSGSLRELRRSNFWGALSVGLLIGMNAFRMVAQLIRGPIRAGHCPSGHGVFRADQPDLRGLRPATNLTVCGVLGRAMADLPVEATNAYHFKLRLSPKVAAEAAIALLATCGVAAILYYFFKFAGSSWVRIPRGVDLEAHGKGAAITGLIVFILAVLPLSGKLLAIKFGGGVGAFSVLMRLIRSSDDRVDYVLDSSGVTDIGLLHSRHLAWGDLKVLHVSYSDGFLGRTIFFNFEPSSDIKPRLVANFPGASPLVRLRPTILIPVSSTSLTSEQALAAVRELAPSLEINEVKPPDNPGFPNVRDRGG